MKKIPLYRIDPFNKQEIGKQAEQKACLFLQAKGWRLLEQNYRSCYGEIDLIMRDHEDIVFVEVRSRANHNDAIASINYKKQQKLIKTGIHFLQKKNWVYKVNSRFDIITVQFLMKEPQINWIKNAFWAEDL